MHRLGLPFLSPPPPPPLQESTAAVAVCPPNPPSRCLHSPRASLSSSSSYSSSYSSPRTTYSLSRELPKPQNRPNLRSLTSRIIKLSRRRQLHQIFEEVELAKRRYGRLNTIVMNAVMEACIHCGDLGSARRVFEDMSKSDEYGLDSVSYAILLKGLGEARRVDEAFQLLEAIERGSAIGCPQLSAHLIYALLNCLVEAGDIRRANGLIARYRFVLHEGQPLLLYNMLIKGYTNSDFPFGALAVRDEILRQGLKPDKLTYNSLIFACVKSGRTDAAIQLLAEMKEEAEKSTCELTPDAITYTTLLKGFGDNKDLLSVMKIVLEMKCSDLLIDRTAYTAIVDALLACGSTEGALCIFAEMIKKAGKDTQTRPKPHLYLSMMRAFAMRGDLEMVKRLNTRMWSDSVGLISPLVKAEVDELLMEAAINDNQVDFAKEILSKIITRKEGFSWTSRGGMIAIKVEALSGFVGSTLSPCILPQVLVDDPVEKYMTAFADASPLPASMTLGRAVLRFFKDSAVPVVDDWGSCVGIAYRTDCSKLDAPLSSMMRGPPPCVTTSTSVGRVIDLLLEKKYQMVIVVRNSNVYEPIYSSSSRPVGVFALENLFGLGQFVSCTQDATGCVIGN